LYNGEPVDFLQLVKDTINGMNLPKEVNVKIEGDTIILSGQDKIIGNKIIIPVNKNLLDNVTKELNNAFIK